MSTNIGIDLGTTKTIIYQYGKGEILREPSIVAINNRNNTVLAVGEKALAMVGCTPSYITAVFPLSEGVISDHALTEVLIKELMKRACDSFLVKQQVIICVPSAITSVERRALVEVLVNAGVRKVFLIDEPIAAAIGTGIDISEPNGRLFVDIGGGTTDVAVISMGGIIVSQSVKYGGNKIDDEIIKFFNSKYKLSIGKRTAELVKRSIGNLTNPLESDTFVVKGLNLLNGLPHKINVSSSELIDAIEPFALVLVEGIRNVLEVTPPELSGDIYENGVTLTGGGALLGGICKYIEKEIKIDVRIAENPIECVSIGTGKAYDYINIFQSGFTKENIGIRL